VERKKKKFTFIACRYDEKVFEAVKKLNQYFIHRMPITKSHEKKSIVGILNYSKILRFILQQMDETYRTSINISIADMNFKFNSTYPTLTMNDTLLQAVQLLSNDKTISAIPIVNKETGEVENAFVRSDIRFFVIDRIYMKLDTKIHDFLARHKNSRHVPQAKMDDSIFDVVMKMLSKRQHMSFVLTKEKKLIGIITLRHVFELLLAGKT